MFKVNFLVAGTQKGGTTALDYYLRTHPDISMAREKEVHFFDNDKNFQGDVDYSAYHSHFDNQEGVVGESTPIYMYWLPAAKRIWEYNPDMKIIVVLRNPIDRAYSHWNVQRYKGADELAFFKAIRVEQKRRLGTLQDRTYSYVDRGFYTKQLRRLYRYFPKEQVLVLKNDDLRNDVNGEMQKVSHFLGVNPFDEIEPKLIHCKPYASEMTDIERMYLRRLFSGEIKRLERMLGWDCSDWLKWSRPQGIEPCI